MPKAVPRGKLEQKQAKQQNQRRTVAKTAVKAKPTVARKQKPKGKVVRKSKTAAVKVGGERKYSPQEVVAEAGKGKLNEQQFLVAKCQFCTHQQSIAISKICSVMKEKRKR